MHPRSLPPLRHVAAALCATALLIVAACGGGGGAAPVAPSVTASSYAQGPISGFGSVIVNGVRWDDSAATVSDDDGNTRSSSDLKLGMVVEVDGHALDHAAGTGEALHIRYGSQLLGPIDAVDTAAGSFTVFGLTVQVSSTTVFDTSIVGGLAGLGAGSVVEVHGLADASTGTIVATRIEARSGATEYRLRGTVSGLDTTARSFALGSVQVSYAGVAEVPPNLADGVQVLLRLQTTPVAGVWVATQVHTLAPPPADRSDAEVEGMITAWASATSFTVGGLAVDASAASFPDGQTGVVLGAHVEVEGAVSNGVLVATTVRLEDQAHEGHTKQFELHGALSALDTTAKTFVLRGLTVSYAGSVGYEHGTAADLADGAKVEVQGTLSADLTTIAAVRIVFE